MTETVIDDISSAAADIYKLLTATEEKSSYKTEYAAATDYYCCVEEPTYNFSSAHTELHVLLIVESAIESSEH